MTKSIFITRKGEIKSLHSDLIDKLIPEAGVATVKRASNIEYDNELHTWVATVLHDGKQFYSDSKAEVLEWEEEYINELIRKGKI